MSNQSRLLELSAAIANLTERSRGAAPLSATSRAEGLYRLVPQIYQELDAENDYVLRHVMRVLDSLVDGVRANTETLYDAWFIESCPPWAIPLIGALVDVQLQDLPDDVLGRLRESVANARLYCAHQGQQDTIARAVGAAGGWPAVGREGADTVLANTALAFEQLPQGRTLNLNDLDAMNALNTPFETAHRSLQVSQHTSPAEAVAPWTAAHSSDAFDIAQFVTQARRVDRIEAQHMQCAGYFTLHPGGLDTALFHPDGSTPTRLSSRTSRDVALPATAQSLRVMAAERASELPIEIFVETRGTQDKALMRIAAYQMRFGPVEAGRTLAGKIVLIDPARGRVKLGEGFANSGQVRIWATYYQGVHGDLGPCADSVAQAQTTPFDWVALVGSSPWSTFEKPSSWPEGVHVFDTLGDALAQFETDVAAVPTSQGDVAPWSAVIHIADSGIYDVPAEAVDLSGQSLTLSAMPGTWPTLCGDLRLRSSKGPASLCVEGVTMDGTVEVDGPIAFAALSCVLGRAHRDRRGFRTAIFAPIHTGPSHAEIRLGNCICGPLRLADGTGLYAADTIFDAGQAPGAAIGGDTKDARGPVCQLDSVTVFGGLKAWQIVRSLHVLVTGRVEVALGPPTSTQDLPIEIAPDLVWCGRQFGQPGYGVPLPYTTGPAARFAPTYGAFQSLGMPERLDMARTAARDQLPLGRKAVLRWVI